MSELGGAARDFGRLESDVSTLKRDVGEVKSGFNELRRDQQNMMKDHSNFGMTLARIESKIETQSAVTAPAPLGKYDAQARWITRGLIVLFILGISGAITLNFEKVDRILRLAEQVSTTSQ